jgi:trehalose 6-phosphate phosphatase
VTAASDRPVDGWSIVRRRVAELVAAGGRLLVVTDFDGTLAGTSLDPMAARIVPLARTALRRFARLEHDRPGRVRTVVLSGRTASDVARRVRVGGIAYLGDHGVQVGTLARGGRAEGLETRFDPSLEPYVPIARDVGPAVSGALGHPDWLFVEDKGPSVAFHFRAADDPEDARRRLGAAVDDALQTVGPVGGRAGGGTVAGDGLVRFNGRRIVELRPAGAGGKGAAMARLLDAEPVTAALVLGDDRSDAEAFEVVAEARRAGRLRVGLAIAVHGADETPAEVAKRADLILGAPLDAARVLSLAARAIEREPWPESRLGSRRSPGRPRS